MKKTVLCLFSMYAIFCCACSSAQASWFGKEKITMYSQRGCPHCSEAKQYIQKYHPGLDIEIVELDDNTAIERLYTCADKFSISRNRVGTPLICFEKDYIMGWSSENAKKFEKLAPKK